MTETSDFWESVGDKIDDHLSNLKGKPFAEVLALSEMEAHDLGPEQITGKSVSFTLFPYAKGGGEVLIVVQASVKAFLGLGFRSFEKGVVISGDGSTRDASEQEILSAL